MSENDSPNDSDTDGGPFGVSLYKAAFALGVTALVIGGIAYTIISSGLLPGILMTIGFVAGAATIPLVAYVIGPSLPGFLAEPLATSLLAAPFLGLRRVVLNQRPDDGFEVEPASAAELGDVAAWGRLAFTKVGVSYDATREAFATPAPPKEINELVPEGRLPDGTPFSSYDLPRHSDWFVELTKGIADGGREVVDEIRVPIGQSLTRLRGAAGTALGEEAIEEAMKKYGGDKSWSSDGRMIVYIMDVVLLLIGLAAGYVIFMNP